MSTTGLVDTHQDIMSPLTGQWFFRDGKEYTNPHHFNHYVENTERTDTVSIRTKITCHRCDGSGHHSFCPAYGTMCFKCSGRGCAVGNAKLYTAERLAILNQQAAKRKERKRAKKAQDKLDTIARLRTEFPEWSKWEKTFPKYSFGWDVMQSIIHKGTYTDRQIEAVRRCYEQEQQSQTRKQQWALENAASDHVGQLGQRTTFTVTIKALKDFDTDYGISTWHLLVDENNNQLIYSGTVDLGDKGDVVKLKATIKKHKIEDDGTKRTKITRPKVND